MDKSGVSPLILLGVMTHNRCGKCVPKDIFSTKDFSVFIHVSTPPLTIFFFPCVGVCFSDIWVCLCMGEWGRIWPVYHLIVIASVFGRETVDRNQQSPVVEVRVGWWVVMGGPCLPLPSVLVVMHPSTNRDQGIRDSGYLY